MADANEVGSRVTPPYGKSVMAGQMRHAIAAMRRLSGWLVGLHPPRSRILCLSSGGQQPRQGVDPRAVGAHHLRLDPDALHMRWQYFGSDGASYAGFVYSHGFSREEIRSIQDNVVSGFMTLLS
jgi:hypothetical protein